MFIENNKEIQGFNAFLEYFNSVLLKKQNIFFDTQLLLVYFRLKKRFFKKKYKMSLIDFFSLLGIEYLSLNKQQMYSNKFFYQYLVLIYNFLLNFKYINLYTLFITIHLYLKQHLIYKLITYKSRLKRKQNRRRLSLVQNKLIIQKNMLKKNDIVNVAKFYIFCETLMQYILIGDRVLERRTSRNWLQNERLKFQRCLLQCLIFFKNDYYPPERTYEVPDFVRWSYDRFQLRYYDYDYNVFLNSKIVDILNDSNLKNLEFFKTKFWKPLIKYRPKRKVVRNFMYRFVKKIRKKIKLFKKYMKKKRFIFCLVINKFLKYYYFNKGINNQNIQQLSFINLTKFSSNFGKILVKIKDVKTISLLNNKDFIYNFFYYSFFYNKFTFDFKNFDLIYFLLKKKNKSLNIFDLKSSFNQKNTFDKSQYDLKFYLKTNFVEDENLSLFSFIKTLQSLPWYSLYRKKVEIVSMLMSKFGDETNQRNSKVISLKYFSKV